MVRFSKVKYCVQRLCVCRLLSRIVHEKKKLVILNGLVFSFTMTFLRERTMAANNKKYKLWSVLNQFLSLHSVLLNRHQKSHCRTPKFARARISCMVASKTMVNQSHRYSRYKTTLPVTDILRPSRKTMLACIGCGVTADSSSKCFKSHYLLHTLGDRKHYV